MVDSAVTVPETVSVAGSDEALDELKVMGNTIWVQDEKSVDISGAKKDVCLLYTSRSVLQILWKRFWSWRTDF